LLPNKSIACTVLTTQRNFTLGTYKQSELGGIPEGWEIYFTSEVIQKTQLGGNYTNSEKETDYLLIRMGNLDRRAIKLDKLKYVISLPNHNDLLKFGDVLFNTRNTLELVGKVAIWRNELPQAYFNSNLMRLTFNEQLVASTFYVNATMNTKTIYISTRGIATGTTSVAAICTRDLLSLKIYLPPKEEQTVIASIHVRHGRWRTNLATMPRKKNRQIKQGMMQELLTGKRD
jgi:type I restriction enzyme S subunit